MPCFWAISPSASYSAPSISKQALSAQTANDSPIGKPVRKYSGSTTNLQSKPIKAILAAICCPNRLIVCCMSDRASWRLLAWLTAWHVTWSAKALKESMIWVFAAMLLDASPHADFSERPLFEPMSCADHKSDCSSCREMKRFLRFWVISN